MAAREQITIELDPTQLLAARHGEAVTHWVAMSPQPPVDEGRPIWRLDGHRHAADWLAGWSVRDDRRARRVGPEPETGPHERLVAQDGTELHQVDCRPERRDGVWGWRRVLEPVRA